MGVPGYFTGAPVDELTGSCGIFVDVGFAVTGQLAVRVQYPGGVLFSIWPFPQVSLGLGYLFCLKACTYTYTHTPQLRTLISLASVNLTSFL